MTKIDIISGFLGAGKTTFIKKMIDEAFTGEKIVLIEVNESLSHQLQPRLNKTTWNQRRRDIIYNGSHTSRCIGCSFQTIEFC